MNKSFPKKKNPAIAFLLAYLFPGLGHFYMGKKGLGLFLFISIVLTYTIGLSLGGGILWDEMNFLTVLAYVVKFFNGFPFLSTLFYQTFHELSLYFNEMGTTFILISGALNLLVIIHLIELLQKGKTECQANS